eukprot:TRINITY_DN2114_c0_g1_i1.p1 TRINITY_DN2114_c0_g1~~TRINITY_DN2114_c0_g1_i1.p1  ORF type:complete len:211 (+),score=62.73 TRINITY_DN2114_c0_g1_i1:270-902(+)
MEISVSTMNVGEIAVIRTNHQYAFGKMGCPPRIPPEAELEFEIELLSVDEVKEAPRPDTFQDKIKKALEAKENGNEKWKKGTFRKANQAYNKALAFLQNLSEEEEELAEEVKLPIHLNLAASFLKLNQPRKAIEACRDALEIDPNNTKALFRMGQSYSDLLDFELAKQSFEKARSLDPKIDLRHELDKIEKNMKLHHEKEKKMYGGMFSK